MWWQGPTLLNPHFATGTKDQDGSRIFYEPLASWDVDGHLNPILAAEIPSIQNGGLSADAKSVVWKLKPGVKWHDGKPVTADDLVFNWEYASDPATACVSISTYSDLTVEKVDDLTIRIKFKTRRRSGPMPLSAPMAASSRNICSPNTRVANPARRRTI